MQQTKLADWMEKYSYLPYLLLGIWSIIFASISVFVINAYAPSYDFDFHLTRLVGLAQSISNGEWLPNLNQLFSYGTGYASDMFYGNWQLYPAALVYLVTKNTTIAYFSLGLSTILFTTISSFYFFKKLSQRILESFLLAAIVACFFPAYGFGMTMVVGLAPALYYALYKVMFKEEYNPILLGIIIALLIQTHILSTLVLAIGSILFLCCTMTRWKWKAVLSFALSAMVGLALSSGYIVQYIEQVQSQPFYFTWVARNFPVDNSLMFRVNESFHSGFTPLTNGFDACMKLALFYFLFQFKTLRPASKSIVGVIIATYLLMSELLPWQTHLKFTFLGSLQYTERLSFFLPILFLLIILMEWEKKMIVRFSGAIFAVYLFTIVYPTTISKFEANLQMMRDRNSRMYQAYQNPRNVFLNPVGDEYYSLDIENGAVRQESFKELSNVNNVRIRDVQYGYNDLKIRYEVMDDSQVASLVLPKIWYKGYQATYSEGGAGGQPRLETVSRSPEELVRMKQLKMPITSEKILNNGKIYLQLEKSGTVHISYKKTFFQQLFYWLEFILWTLVGIGWLLQSRKIFRKFNQKP
ncbi:hypothetical protein [Streptococcus suis]|uniref:hypothetical protein n=1 Tax=Streptococcus suis TaxID=1307 RepID=UPI0019319E20|nr:hypothetical protein [Streptococcus suis]MBM0195237.1 hypothetical protein [Streptococcus suis]MBM7316374.1 hypothetical protein [Streptococcus suis]